ncbi:MAG: hypothetical protein R2845_08080 [Thermomicrobiales bacterium]
MTGSANTARVIDVARSRVEITIRERPGEIERQQAFAEYAIDRIAQVSQY